MKRICLNKAIYMYLYLGITTGKYKTSVTHLGWPERKGGGEEGEGGPRRAPGVSKRCNGSGKVKWPG